MIMENNTLSAENEMKCLRNKNNCLQLKYKKVTEKNVFITAEKENFLDNQRRKILLELEAIQNRYNKDFPMLMFKLYKTNSKFCGYENQESEARQLFIKKQLNGA